MLIKFTSPLDALTKLTLQRAVGVAEAHGFGLSIGVALDRAGQAVFYLEPLPVSDRHAGCGLRDGSADEIVPPP